MAEGSSVNYWSLVTIIGPLLLLGVIAYAVLRNRKSKVDPNITEDATRRNYDSEQKVHEKDPGSGL